MIVFKENGMDTITAITTRFSVRKYTSEPVTDEQLSTLLTAGFSAPSACNARPWEFIVVRDRAKLDAIAENGRYQKMLRQAPLAIIICADSRRGIEPEFSINDCSAAAENILLAAHAIGLGGCWCGLLPREGANPFISELLGLPDHVIPAALLAIGHPDEERVQPDRFDPSCVHYDKF